MSLKTKKWSKKYSKRDADYNGMLTVAKGPLNNYMDKMRGRDGVKKCLFLSTLRV